MNYVCAAMIIRKLPRRTTESAVPVPRGRPSRRAHCRECGCRARSKCCARSSPATEWRGRASGRNKRLSCWRHYCPYIGFSKCYKTFPVSSSSTNALSLCYTYEIKTLSVGRLLVAVLSQPEVLFLDVAERAEQGWRSPHRLLDEGVGQSGDPAQPLRLTVQVHEERAALELLPERKQWDTSFYSNTIRLQSYKPPGFALISLVLERTELIILLSCVLRLLGLGDDSRYHQDKKQEQRSSRRAPHNYRLYPLCALEEERRWVYGR